MKKIEILELAVAVIIGLAIGFIGYKVLKDSPCFDGSSISETPNYCLR